MSTNDVPGSNPANGDTLKALCWAEHEDGSLLFVESTEGGRIIYSIFNMSDKPAVEYRDAMPLKGFEDLFSYTTNKRKGKKPIGDVVWTWHDKTPFPWDRIIEDGFKDGVRHTHVEEQLSAALRVAKARNLINLGKPINVDKIKTFMDSMGVKGRTITDKIQRAIHELRV
jgi:hypothetical protein